jgi:hypothetical protein
VSLSIGSGWWTWEESVDAAKEIKNIMIILMTVISTVYILSTCAVRAVALHGMSEFLKRRS